MPSQVHSSTGRERDKQGMSARNQWTRAETRNLLESLRVVKAKGLDPNDSRDWYKPENENRLKDLLKAKSVVEQPIEKT